MRVPLPTLAERNVRVGDFFRRPCRAPRRCEEPTLRTGCSLGRLTTSMARIVGFPLHAPALFKLCFAGEGEEVIGDCERERINLLSYEGNRKHLIAISVRTSSCGAL